MLILDKRKAIERVVALTSGADGVSPEAEPPRTHARTYQRVAVYQRRAPIVLEAAATRSAERRRRRLRLTVEPSSTLF